MERGKKANEKWDVKKREVRTPSMPALTSWKIVFQVVPRKELHPICRPEHVGGFVQAP